MLLDLTGCFGITDTVLETISLNCPNLDSLNLKETDFWKWTSIIQYQDTDNIHMFGNIETLNGQNCDRLSEYLEIYLK